MKHFPSSLLACGVSAIALMVSMASLQAQTPPNSYVEDRLVANKKSYGAKILDRKMINAWGMANRPSGAGGHFWVLGGDISFEYVGDVKLSDNKKLRTLHTDDLAYVKLPVGGKDNVATGVVFNNSDTHFTITQQVKGAEPITAPAKFIFASDGGIISAWTERKKPNGGFDRAPDALKVVDDSDAGAQYFGLAISHDYTRLYAADFGAKPGIRVFDGSFKPIDVKFGTPFDENRNGQVDPGEYAPFNIQALMTPKDPTDEDSKSEPRIFVTYAKTQACPAEEVKKKTCKEGELFVGEEDTSTSGNGRLAEFTEDGKLIKVWQDGGKLSAPWGLVYAPAEGFGALSGALLVGNFGDGTIAAYHAQTKSFIDVMRDTKGNPIKIDKLWGLMFGNGESLGDADALYYAAGPNDEKDGLFGSLRLSK